MRVVTLATNGFEFAQACSHPVDRRSPPSPQIVASPFDFPKLTAGMSKPLKVFADALSTRSAPRPNGAAFSSSAQKQQPVSRGREDPTKDPDPAGEQQPAPRQTSRSVRRGPDDPLRFVVAARRAVEATLGRLPSDDEPLMAAGIDSLGAVEVAAELKARFPSASLDEATLLFERPTIRALAELLESGAGSEKTERGEEEVKHGPNDQPTLAAIEAASTAPGESSPPPPLLSPGTALALPSVLRPHSLPDPAARTLSVFDATAALPGVDTDVRLRPGDAVARSSRYACALRMQRAHARVITPVHAWNPDEVDAGVLSQASIRPPGLARFAALLRDVDLVDASALGLSPYDAATLDPQHRLLLEQVADLCLSATAAGVLTSRTRPTCGFTVGCMHQGEYASTVLRPAQLALSASASSGSSLAFLAGRPGYTLDLGGPCAAVDTACSSSLVAVHLSATDVLLSRASLSIASGVSLLLSETTHAAIGGLGAASPSGRCRSLDADADGYGRAEGIVTVMLADGATVLRLERPSRPLAVLASTAADQDGRAAGLAAPHGPSQTRLLEAATREAGGDHPSLLALHGTGTPLGDPIEVGAAAAARGEKAQRGDSHFSTLTWVAPKSRWGHSEGAAGAVGVLMAAQAVHTSTVDALAGLRNVNPHVERALARTSPDAVPRVAGPWVVPHCARRVGSSSFGMSGVNAHAIIDSWSGKELGGLGWDASAQAKPRPFERARRWALPPTHPLLWGARLDDDVVSLHSRTSASPLLTQALRGMSIDGRFVFPLAALADGVAGGLGMLGASDASQLSLLRSANLLGPVEFDGTQDLSWKLELRRGLVLCSAGEAVVARAMLVRSESVVPAQSDASKGSRMLRFAATGAAGLDGGALALRPIAFLAKPRDHEHSSHAVAAVEAAAALQGTGLVVVAETLATNPPRPEGTRAEWVAGGVVAAASGSTNASTWVSGALAMHRPLRVRPSRVRRESSRFAVPAWRLRWRRQTRTPRGPTPHSGPRRSALLLQSSWSAPAALRQTSVASSDALRVVFRSDLASRPAGALAWLHAGSDIHLVALVEHARQIDGALLLQSSPDGHDEAAYLALVGTPVRNAMARKAGTGAVKVGAVVTPRSNVPGARRDAAVLHGAH